MMQVQLLRSFLPGLQQVFYPVFSSEESWHGRGKHSDWWHTRRYLSAFVIAFGKNWGILFSGTGKCAGWSADWLRAAQQQSLCPNVKESWKWPGTDDNRAKNWQRHSPPAVFFCDQMESCPQFFKVHKKVGECLSSEVWSTAFELGNIYCAND